MGPGRKSLAWAAAALLVLAALAAGCGAGGGEKGKSEDRGKAATESVKTGVGREFSIELESNPSTGYRWSLAEPVDSKILRPLGGRHEHIDMKPGAPGRQVFYFTAVGEGTTDVFFEYRRPWEKDAAAAEKKTVSVVVEPGGSRGERMVFTDPNVPIDVAVGRDFTVELEANPTTGYEWQLASPLDEKVLKSEGSEYVSDATGVRMGAGGKESWFFEAVGAGETRISLVYVRPWEKDVPPAKTATFNVKVR